MRHLTYQTDARYRSRDSTGGGQTKSSWAILPTKRMRAIVRVTAPTRVFRLLSPNIWISSSIADRIHRQSFC
jgi:hypothetical protein